MTSTDQLDTWHDGGGDDGRAHCQRCGGSFPSGFLSCPYDATALIVGRDPLIGSIIAGRYKIESLAGEGGIGRVYLAQHTRIQRRYALKVPSGQASGDLRGRERFIREAQAASRLDHPNVVSVLDFGETDAGLLYLVMELADGETLADVLEQRHPLAATEALSLVRQLALGLEHAHERGLIHRDLKPENVIIERSDGRPRILDFGLAILTELGESDRLTSQRTVVGTPHYMSPEHVCGLPLDARTDLFSLGILFYRAITGCMPFEATPIEVAQRYLNDRIPSFGERVPGLAVDREVEALCLELVARTPQGRPPNATAVIDRTDRLLDRFAAERGGRPPDPAPSAPTIAGRVQRARGR